MDFTSNRGVQPSVGRSSASNSRGTSDNNNKNDDDKGDRVGRGYSRTPKWLKVAFVSLLFAGTLIVIGIITMLLINPGSESRLVDKDRYQAVFLDNGQVYFGKINNMGNGYIDLSSVYYLNVQQSLQPSEDTETQENQEQNITLQKLGCELHGPTDRMVVNREHVIFWENLRSEGQVTKAISDWVSNNPEGLTCDNGNSNESTSESGNSSTNGSDNSATDNSADQSTSNGQ